jgi:ligand-binding SRPBCC domain-containing protein
VTAELELRTVIAAPVELVYELSLSVEEHVASMGRSGEDAVGARRSGTLRNGDEVTWRGRHFGLPFTMTSRVVTTDPPHSFVDEQVRGPFARFRHEHRFTSGLDATVMLDRVSFDAPLGVLGDIVEAMVLRRYLAKIIGERNAYLKTRAERTAPR